MNMIWFFEYRILWWCKYVFVFNFQTTRYRTKRNPDTQCKKLLTAGVFSDASSDTVAPAAKRSISGRRGGSAKSPLNPDHDISKNRRLCACIAHAFPFAAESKSVMHRFATFCTSWSSGKARPPYLRQNLCVLCSQNCHISISISILLFRNVCTQEQIPLIQPLGLRTKGHSNQGSCFQ